MQHILGISRTQVSFGTFEDGIGTDNSVRFIDAFSSKLDLSKIGFTVSILKKEAAQVLNRVCLCAFICMVI